MSCLEAVGVEGLEGVQALVGPVRPPVPPDAGRPRELGDNPSHVVRFTLKLQLKIPSKPFAVRQHKHNWVPPNIFSLENRIEGNI